MTRARPPAAEDVPSAGAPAEPVREPADPDVALSALRHEQMRLASLERIKSQFLNLVAHELRTPLAVARGYVSMIADGDFGSVHAADVSGPIAIIAAKLNEIGSLVDQMLETARLESGQLHLRFERVALREVVHDALRLMTPLARDHRIIAVWGPGDDAIVADRERVVTILTNLLDNACKYSPAGTSVEVRTGRSDDAVTVAVVDQGMGIDAHDLPTLFTQFGRIVNERTAHISGSGLGLYVCRDLARMHGGDITVAANPAGGSVFTLTLPAPSRPAAASDESGTGDSG